MRATVGGEKGRKLGIPPQVPFRIPPIVLFLFCVPFSQIRKVLLTLVHQSTSMGKGGWGRKHSETPEMCTNVPVLDSFSVCLLINTHIAYRESD